MANEEMIQTHVDNFLAKIAGETPIDDKPRNSTEFWLNKIAENGGGGTTVVANPTLAGTEDALTGLQVGETKYSVFNGGLYLHTIRSSQIKIEIITGTSTQFTDATLAQWLFTNGFSAANTGYYCNSAIFNASGNYFNTVEYIYSETGESVKGGGKKITYDNSTFTVTGVSSQFSGLSGFTDTVISIL